VTAKTNAVPMLAKSVFLAIINLQMRQAHGTNALHNRVALFTSLGPNPIFCASGLNHHKLESVSCL